MNQPPEAVIARWRQPLHVALSALVVSSFVVFYLVLATVQYQQSSRRMLAAADDTFRLLGRQSTEFINALLLPAQGALALLSESEPPRALSPEDTPRWLRLMSAGLRQNPAADAVYLAFGDGSFLLLRPLGDALTRQVVKAPDSAQWLLQVVDRHTGQPTGRFDFFGAALNLIERRPMPAYRFDPRDRQWYRDALVAGHEGSIRTPPYAFFTTRATGVTLARRHEQAQEVVGIDLGVDTLASRLKRELVTPSAQAVIFDATGRVLAHPGSVPQAAAGAGTVTADRRVAGLGVPVLAALHARFMAEQAAASVVTGAPASAAWGEHGAVMIEVNGRDWFYRVDPVAEGLRGEAWFLAIAAPADELLAGAISARRTSLWVSLLILLLTLPVVLLITQALARPLRFLAKDAESIERFEFDAPDHPGSLITEVDDLAHAMRNMKHTLRRFLDISSALSAETRFDGLLQQVLGETVSVTRASGGVIRLLDRDGLQLEPAAVQMRGQVEAVSALKPLRLDEPGGNSTARQAALEGRTVIAEKHAGVPDEQAYYAAVFERLEVDRFQVLAVPLRNRKQELIGTLELSFAEAPDRRQWRIAPARVAFIEALSGTAAVAIDNQRLLMEQKALLESFIELVAGAIDAKSPYTGGHCQRVPELTKMLAAAACAQSDGPFASYQLNDEQWEALHIAAWLHDCGKVTTPEYVVDKATKLETLYDRIHEVRMRFEVLKRDAEVGLCREALAQTGVDTTGLDTRLAEMHRQLDSDFHFVALSNEGGEFMSPASQERLHQIATMSWWRTLDDRIGISQEEQQRKARRPAEALPVREQLLADKPEHIFPRPAQEQLAPDNPWGFSVDLPEHLYNRGELHNLGVERGTLTAEERYKINDHMAQTIRMLAQLPFPRHLRAVPEIAGGHHEKMDGTGYPRRLKREQLSVSARMVAVADVFEALTATDRPYKKGKTLSESLQIMAVMCEKQHIDADVFGLFLRSGVYLAYAQRYMQPAQIDGVDINHYLSVRGPGLTLPAPLRQSGCRRRSSCPAAYSRFCTCSRICSIATFISTAVVVNSREAAFEARVLASRSSSWIRKSSRLPTSPPAFSSRAISSRWARRRASSSATSMRMA